MKKIALLSLCMASAMMFCSCNDLFGPSREIRVQHMAIVQADEPNFSMNREDNYSAVFWSDSKDWHGMNDQKNCEGHTYLVDLALPFRTPVRDDDSKINAYSPFCKCTKPSHLPKWGWLLELVVDTEYAIKGAANHLICFNYYFEHDYKLNVTYYSSYSDEELEALIKKTSEEFETPCWKEYESLRKSVLDEIVSVLPKNTISDSVYKGFLMRKSDEEVESIKTTESYYNDHLVFELPACSLEALLDKLEDIELEHGIWFDPDLRILGYDDGTKPASCSGNAVTPELIYSNIMASLEYDFNLDSTVLTGNHAKKLVSMGWSEEAYINHSAWYTLLSESMFYSLTDLRMYCEEQEAGSKDCEYNRTGIVKGEGKGVSRKDGTFPEFKNQEERSSSVSFVIQSPDDIEAIADYYETPVADISKFIGEIRQALNGFDYASKTAVVLLGPLMGFPFDVNASLKLNPACSGSPLEISYITDCEYEPMKVEDNGSYWGILEPEDPNEENYARYVYVYTNSRDYHYFESYRWPIAIYSLPKASYTIKNDRHFSYACHK